MPKVGTLFCGKYEISHSLGTGGMGVVLAAKHVRLDQPVALKFLKDEQLEDRNARLRFEREARAAARLVSPHAVRIHDVDSTPEGVPFIVMEILTGYDLSSRLKTHKQLPYAEVVDWVLSACHAVAEAHSVGIVHRDLKPSNLFMAEGAMGEPIVKVLDFGISKIIDGFEPELTNTDMTLGTPHYMSPEQVGVGKVVDGRTDTWALSVILYRAITGAYPFHAPAATQIAVAIATEPAVPIEAHTGEPIPPGLSKAIMKGLEKEPGRRFQDAHALAEAISQYGTGKIAPPIRQSRPRTDPLRNPKSLPPPAPSTRPPESASTVNNIEQTKNMTSIEMPIEVAPRAASAPTKKWLFAVPLSLGIVGLVLALASTKHAKPAPASAPPATLDLEGTKPDPAKVDPVAPLPSGVAEPPPSASAAPSAKPLRVPGKRPLRPTTSPVPEDPVHL